MENFINFVAPYRVFAIPIFVGIFAQSLKFLLFTLKHGWNPAYAMTHGHMPSAHTAFIISLVVSVFHYDGFDSGAFAVAVILAVIVIDDAVRLRMYLGDQGRYLNNLIHQLNLEENYPRLKERVGHRVSEVIAGGIFGFFLTILLIQILK